MFFCKQTVSDISKKPYLAGKDGVEVGPLEVFYQQRVHHLHKNRVLALQINLLT